MYAQSSASRPLITGVSRLSVYTSDGSKTEHFYVHDMGGVKRSDPENPAGVRYYFSPIQFVEVLPLPSAQPDSKNRMDHVAFNTADAESLRKYLAAHNVPVPSQVQKGDDGSSWFQVEDPEGNHIQFVQAPAFSREPFRTIRSATTSSMSASSCTTARLRTLSFCRCLASAPIGMAAQAAERHGSRSRCLTEPTGWNTWSLPAPRQKAFRQRCPRGDRRRSEPFLARRLQYGKVGQHAL